MSVLSLFITFTLQALCIENVAVPTICVSVRPVEYITRNISVRRVEAIVTFVYLRIQFYFVIEIDYTRWICNCKIYAGVVG
jgi:hypothetical protein